jgi:hypothetical protein
MASSPDRIAFAKLKLARIAVHLYEINGIIRDLANSDGTYEILTDANGKETLHFLVDAPADIQIVAGEIIYQFRSALDHLAFQLVKSNPTGIELPDGWEGRCQFPLVLNIPAKGNPPVPYQLPVPREFFEDRLPGISKPAYTFIEGVQPYHSGAGIHNILRIVGKLANIDKHKHPYVLLPRIAVRNDVVYSDGMLGTSVVGGFKHGAEIPLPDEIPGESPMNVRRSFTPYITFDETIGAGPDTLGTEDILKVCLEQFEAVIIPAFEKLI